MEVEFMTADTALPPCMPTLEELMLRHYGDELSHERA